MKHKAKPVKGSARTQRFDVGGTVGALAGLGTLAYLMSRKKKGEAGKAESKSPVSGPIPGMQGGQGDLAPSMVDTTSKVDEAAKRRAMAASAGRPEMGGGDKAIMDSDKTAETTPRKTTSTTPRKTTSTTPRKTTAPKTTLDVVKTLKPGERGQSRSDLPSKPFPEKEAAQAKVTQDMAKAGATPMRPSDKEIKDIKAKQAATTGAKRTRYAKKKVEERTRVTGPKRTRYAKKPVTDKTYAEGGVTKSKPAPKKAPMPAFARDAKENRERDQRVKREREEFDKGAPTRLKDQGSFKSGGMTASKRGDGIAMRGKTRGKMY